MYHDGIWSINAFIWVPSNSNKQIINIGMTTPIGQGKNSCIKSNKGNNRGCLRCCFQLWWSFYSWQPNLIVHSLLCGAKLGKDSNSHIFGLSA